jgi:hypothetical protein
MKKKYFYEFSGNVYLEANDKDEAEKLLTGISLEDFLIDERVFEVDENYIAYDQQKREDQLGTYFHPLDDPDDFETYKIRKCRYGKIFNEFLHGKFDKNELMKRMTEADANDEILDGCDLFSEISMINLKGKKFKLVRDVNAD